MDADRIRYQLKYPISVQRHNGAGVETVTISDLSLERRVKGRHMMAADGAKGPIETKIRVIGALAGLSEDQAMEIDQEDLEAIDDLLEDEGGSVAFDPLAGPPAS